jgi:DNA mismatch endonuclease, patch repair protein
MPDKFSPEVRSRIMSAIRSTGTKLEKIVMEEMEERGLEFARNVRKLFGSPDLAFEDDRIVIFIDSCFWHGCPLHYKRPKSNQEYWDEKYRRNRARDEKVNQHYEDLGWGLMRVWEHEIKEDFEKAMDEMEEFILLCKEIE